MARGAKRGQTEYKERTMREKVGIVQKNEEERATI